MENLPGFHFVGISVRTTNEQNQSAVDIAALWQRLYQDQVLEKIPGSVGSEIFCIYTDYESDFRGNYTTLLGKKVSRLDQVPEGLVARTFPGGDFQKYTAKGNMPEALIEAWKQIWKQEAEIFRSYAYDLEVYGPQSQAGEGSEVDIYLSLQPQAGRGIQIP